MLIRPLTQVALLNTRVRTGLICWIPFDDWPNPWAANPFDVISGKNTVGAAGGGSQPVSLLNPFVRAFNGRQPICAYIQGSGSHFAGPAFVFPKKFTVCFWVNPINFTGTCTFFDIGDDSNSGVRIDYDGNFDVLNFNAYTTNGLDGFSSNNPIPLSKFTHVAASWDGSADSNPIRIYFNGKIDNTNSSLLALAAPISSDLILGTDTIFANPYHGLLDDFRYYNRVLSTGEINIIVKEALRPQFYNETIGLMPGPPPVANTKTLSFSQSELVTLIEGRSLFKSISVNSASSVSVARQKTFTTFKTITISMASIVSIITAGTFQRLKTILVSIPSSVSVATTGTFQRLKTIVVSTSSMVTVTTTGTFQRLKTIVVSSASHITLTRTVIFQRVKNLAIVQGQAVTLTRVKGKIFSVIISIVSTQLGSLLSRFIPGPPPPPAPKRYIINGWYVDSHGGIYYTYRTEDGQPGPEPPVSI